VQKAISQLEPEWQKHLQQEWDKPYFKSLQSFIKQDSSPIYPSELNYFAALNMTSLKNVKVVILGQDPYHGEGQAHGLSFSVPEGVKTPPSLKNIYKELSADLEVSQPKSGCLSGWAKQGVLLLNATLTVRAGQAGSHQKKGWEEFTDKIIQILNEKKKGLVFMLWGSYAQKKGRKIDESKHLVLKSVHPSPLSAYRGFLGCKHFSKANKYLTQQQKKPINWANNSDL